MGRRTRVIRVGPADTQGSRQERGGKMEVRETTSTSRSRGPETAEGATPLALKMEKWARARRAGGTDGLWEPPRPAAGPRNGSGAWDPPRTVR